MFAILFTCSAMNTLYVSSFRCVFFSFSPQHHPSIPHPITSTRKLFHPPPIAPPCLHCPPLVLTPHPQFSSLPFPFSSSTPSCRFTSLSTRPSLSLHASLSPTLLSLPLAASRKLLLVIINLQSTKHMRSKRTHDTLDAYTQAFLCAHRHTHTRAESFTATEPESYTARS